MPDPSIASLNGELDLKRAAARNRAEQAATQLATNIMRIARGTGKPELLVENAVEYLKAAREFHDTHGRWPAGEVHDWLRVREEVEVESVREQVWSLAENTVVSGALQIAASRLAAQRAQEAAGRSELFRGLAVIEAQRAENRKDRRD